MYNDYPKAIQLAFTELCDYFGLTPSGLAVLAHMSPQTMNHIMSGKSNPSGRTYQKIADALDITYADVVCWIRSAEVELGLKNFETNRSTESGTLVSQRLYDLRTETGKTLMQVRLATGAPIDYEKAIKERDFSTLIALADYFGVSVDYLLGRTENPDMAK